MTPETKALAIAAIADLHDDLLDEGRDSYPSEFKDVYPRERTKIAKGLLACRRALRELRANPIALPRNDCE